MIQNQVIFMTPDETARTLGIGTVTLNFLVSRGSIPYNYIQFPDTKESKLRFNSWDIEKWMESKPKFDFNGDKVIENLQTHFQAAYPETLDELKKINRQFAERQRYKGYSLRKVPNKKHGFLYYVKYIRDGKVAPSQWNTHTNNLIAAEAFAKENREKILAAYDQRKAESGPKLYEVLKNYYSAKSPYLEETRNRGRILGKKTRNIYMNFTNKIFVPFIKECRITEFKDITPPIIAKLQTHLLKKGNNPQTINRYIGAVRAIFKHLVMNGVITENAFDKVTALKEKKCQKIRGCHEIEKVNGVFNREWHDEMSYLLCLMIYSTGLRNSEIARIKVQNIKEINGCRFIDVRKSKSENGLRVVPIHSFAYEKVMDYVKKAEKKEDDYIFSKLGGPNQSTLYNMANIELGRRLGKNKEELEKEYITFYSGRHYWKTLINAHGLGDVEEYFMGHRVSRDVAKLYNHLDKQGQEMLVKKAKDVFEILDKTLFKR